MKTQVKYIHTCKNAHLGKDVTGVESTQLQGEVEQNHWTSLPTQSHLTQEIPEIKILKDHERKVSQNLTLLFYSSPGICTIVPVGARMLAKRIFIKTHGYHSYKMLC